MIYLQNSCPLPLHSICHNPQYVRISYNSPTVPGRYSFLAGYLTTIIYQINSTSSFFPYNFPQYMAESYHSQHLVCIHTWRPPGSRHLCCQTLPCWIKDVWRKTIILWSNLLLVFPSPGCSSFIWVFVIHGVCCGEVSAILKKHLRKHNVTLIPS